MNRFENIEKELRKHNISGHLPAQNIFHIAGVSHANVLFHKYTHADKAIGVLKELGYNTGERQSNSFNAYFKYYITIK